MLLPSKKGIGRKNGKEFKPHHNYKDPDFDVKGLTWIAKKNIWKGNQHKILRE